MHLRFFYYIAFIITTSLWSDTINHTPIASFLGEPKLESQQIFKKQRFPNIVITPKGTLIASFGSSEVSIRRSEDGGKTWGEKIKIAKGLHGGGTTVNDLNGDIFVFLEMGHPPSPLKVFKSSDDGLSWKKADIEIKPNSLGHLPSMHMNEHGTTIKYGKHKGRIIKPTRYYGLKNKGSKKKNEVEKYYPTHYTNAMYSDDGGKTWQTSEPFPEKGTGEAAFVELFDGSIYYNTRRHWAPEEKNPRRRWDGMSYDGGKTWEQVSICKPLPDGRQNRDYGLMGGLIRLPVADKNILVFSNIQNDDTRANGTLWVSFDGGKTWPLKRMIDHKNFAYSSLNVGKANTASEGWIYLHAETGGDTGSRVIRFNLSWLLGGELTGDGSIPTDFNRS